MKTKNQYLKNAANEHYRQLAEYDKTTVPIYLKLQNVELPHLRALILERWQQVKAELYRAFFDRQNGPEYLASRFDKRRGAYPSRLIYLAHEFYPVRGWCALALDQTRRVPAGTFAPHRRPEQRLADEEREGYEYLIKRRQSNPDARAQVAADLLRVAQILARNSALNILLATGASQLRQLSSGAGNALGYVAYFFECWAKFHEYEETPPAKVVKLSDAEAARLRGEIDRIPAEIRLASAKNLLSPDVASSHDYLTELLEQCAELPNFTDIANTLRSAFEQRKTLGHYEAEEFLASLPAYANKLLAPEISKQLNSTGGLFQSLRHNLQLFKSQHETWPRWGTADLPRLEARRQDLAQRLALAEQGSNAAHVVERWREVKGDEAAAAIEKAQQKKQDADLAELPVMLARVDSILAALDTATAAGVALVTAGELAAPHPHSTTTAPAPAAPVGPFMPLLLNYTLADLTALLGELGLLDTATTKASPAASPGAWVGIIYALLEAKRPRLKGSKASIWRAFNQTFGAGGSVRTVQNGLGTRGSEAEKFRDRALIMLNS